MLMQASASTGYSHLAGQANASTAPRELTYLERAEGLRNGSDEALCRLQALAARIHGEPMPDTSKVRPPGASGLPACLADTEQNLRGVIDSIAQLERAFLP